MIDQEWKESATGIKVRRGGRRVETSHSRNWNMSRAAALFGPLRPAPAHGNRIVGRPWNSNRQFFRAADPDPFVTFRAGSRACPPALTQEGSAAEGREPLVSLATRLS